MIVPLIVPEQFWFGTLRSAINNPQAHREITPQEWDRVVVLVTDYGLPCTMDVGRAGFGLMLTVLSNVAPFPPLVTINHDQFPGRKGKVYDQDTYEVLGAMTKYTHSVENRKILAELGLPEPPDPHRMAHL